MKSYNSFTYYGYWLPRVKFSVRFSLRLQGQSEVGSIVVSVTHAGKRFLYSLGFHRIPAWHWDKARQRMLPRTPRAQEINAEIDRHLEAVILFYSSARNVDAEQPTLDGLKAMLFPERVNAVKRVEQGSIVGLFTRIVTHFTEYITGIKMRMALVLLVAVTLLSCSSDSGTSPTADSSKHYVGQSYGGGVVFYTWKDVRGEEHGLIVSIRNLSDSSIWSNVDAPLWPVKLDWYDGKYNTAAIIAQKGHVNSAALLCANYSNAGYDDWYLPTLQELTILYNNIPAVNYSLSAIGGALPIGTFAYWSSIERSDSTVYVVLYSDLGNPTYAGPKYSKLPVRAVRSF